MTVHPTGVTTGRVVMGSETTLVTVTWDMRVATVRRILTIAVLVSGGGF